MQEDNELNEMDEIQTPNVPDGKTHRFNIYEIVVFTLIAALIWAIGQFTPGIPDELLLLLLEFVVYGKLGKRPPRK